MNKQRYWSHSSSSDSKFTWEENWHGLINIHHTGRVCFFCHRCVRKVNHTQQSRRFSVCFTSPQNSFSTQALSSVFLPDSHYHPFILVSQIPHRLLYVRLGNSHLSSGNGGWVGGSVKGNPRSLEGLLHAYWTGREPKCKLHNSPLLPSWRHPGWEIKDGCLQGWTAMKPKLLTGNPDRWTPYSSAS